MKLRRKKQPLPKETAVLEQSEICYDVVTRTGLEPMLPP